MSVLLKINSWLQSYAESTASHVSAVDKELIPYLLQIQNLSYEGKRVTGQTKLQHVLNALELGGTRFRKTYFEVKREFREYCEKLYHGAQKEFHTQDSQRKRPAAFSSAYFASVPLNNIFGRLWVEHVQSLFDLPLLRAIEYVFQNATRLEETKTQFQAVTVEELKALVAAGEKHWELVRGIQSQNRDTLATITWATTGINEPRKWLSKRLSTLSLALRALRPNNTQRSVYQERLREELLKTLKIIAHRLNNADETQQEDIVGIELRKAEQEQTKAINVWKGEACRQSHALYAKELLAIEQYNLDDQCISLVSGCFTEVLDRIACIQQDLTTRPKRHRLNHLQSLFRFLEERLKEDVTALENPKPAIDEKRQDWLYLKAIQVDLSRGIIYMLRLMSGGVDIQLVLYEQIAKLETDTFEYMKSQTCVDSLTAIEQGVYQDLLSLPVEYIQYVDIHVKLCEVDILESYEFYIKELDTEPLPIPSFACAPVKVDISKLDIQEEIEAALLVTKDKAPLEAFRRVKGKDCPFNILWEAVMCCTAPDQESSHNNMDEQK